MQLAPHAQMCGSERLRCDEAAVQPWSLGAARGCAGPDAVPAGDEVEELQEVVDALHEHGTLATAVGRPATVASVDTWRQRRGSPGSRSATTTTSRSPAVSGRSTNMSG